MMAVAGKEEQEENKWPIKAPRAQGPFHKLTSEWDGSIIKSLSDEGKGKKKGKTSPC